LRPCGKTPTRMRAKKVCIGGWLGGSTTKGRGKISPAAAQAQIARRHLSIEAPSVGRRMTAQVEFQLVLDVAGGLTPITPGLDLLIAVDRHVRRQIRLFLVVLDRRNALGRSREHTATLGESLKLVHDSAAPSLVRRRHMADIRQKLFVDA